MTHTEALTKYVGNFIDELAKSGVAHAVISPGSRSTPLAMMITEHPDIREWVLVDERSASFFALGLARATEEPVVLVCTSGTAAANYYPAVIEAHEQRIPLIVLTADRPHELRDTGASQTMNQLHLYGDFVKWFHEMALPEATDQMLAYVRTRAARAYTEAKHFGNEGPVQLNFPFREPLVPDLTLEDKWGDRQENYIQTIHGQKSIGPEDLHAISHALKGKERGMIVCGPQFDESWNEAIVELSNHLKIPIIADPLSQLRAYGQPKDTVIEGFDTILYTKEEREKLNTDYIIRFGAMPISKRYLHYINEQKNILHIVVEKDSGVREPTNTETTFVYSDVPVFCELLTNILPKGKENKWLQTWQEKNAIVQAHLQAASNDTLTEGEAVRTVFEIMPSASGVFMGNSMPIRDADTFMATSNKAIKMYGNRGVSGIEGITSTALGIAASDVHEHMTLIIGDLSFYHDLNGLFASKKYHLSLTILLLNNDGGGIFSFLPQAKNGHHFEDLFGTPMGMDFSHAAHLYGADYRQVDTREMLQEAMKESYETKGLHIIEVQTDRDENVRWHKKLWTAIQEELAKC